MLHSSGFNILTVNYVLSTYVIEVYIHIMYITIDKDKLTHV